MNDCHVEILLVGQIPEQLPDALLSFIKSREHWRAVTPVL
jgi:hypothetical protein